MDTLDALILGIIQGLAEYLPISSSGHIEIGRQILGIKIAGDEALQFSIVLHVATVLSTIVVLWKEFVPLITSFFGFKRDANTTYVWKILLSCVPVMIVGLFFKDTVEEFFGNGLLVVGICLIATAALLSFAYFFRQGRETAAPASRGRDITFLDAFIIGIAQAVAVLPGLSRSGSTIATGIMLGDNREKVAKFSFFMVIIPILGEALLDAKKLIFPDEGATATMEVGYVQMLVGFLASFIVGCIACKWMLNIVKKGKLVWFAVYCLAAGLLCIFY